MPHDILIDFFRVSHEGHIFLFAIVLPVLLLYFIALVRRIERIGDRGNGFSFDDNIDLGPEKFFLILNWINFRDAALISVSFDIYKIIACLADVFPSVSMFSYHEELVLSLSLLLFHLILWWFWIKCRRNSYIHYLLSGEKDSKSEASHDLWNEEKDRINETLYLYKVLTDMYLSVIVLTTNAITINAIMGVK
jgi:hypothetical protein